jgi:hypothetical protein
MDPILKLQELYPNTAECSIILDHFSTNNRYVFVIKCKLIILDNMVDACYVLFYDTNCNFISFIRPIWCTNPTRIASFADKIFICEECENDSLFFNLFDENRSYEDGVTQLDGCPIDEIQFRKEGAYFHVYGSRRQIISFVSIHSCCCVLMNH